MVVKKKKKEKRKEYANEGIHDRGKDAAPEAVPDVPQTDDQRKMAFASSSHVATVLQILKECGGVPALVGKTEYETIVNAVTLDAQQEMIKNFITAIDSIKSGSLFNRQ